MGGEYGEIVAGERETERQPSHIVEKGKTTKEKRVSERRQGGGKD